ncbi:MAG: PocR ligand-binding domain-containing protein [Firmicutes bacterium]|nr:PocR ligand-binding domain-containing protein [Bacillota bacterium]
MEQSGAEFYGGQEWEVRQAELAERYEAPLVTVDSAGEAITGCARCPDFCRVIMVNPVSRRGCQAHCAALAAEALRLGGGGRRPLPLRALYRGPAAGRGHCAGFRQLQGGWPGGWPTPICIRRTGLLPQR